MLHKDTAEYTILDEIEKQYIFVGTTRLDENGYPLNGKYFDAKWGRKADLLVFPHENVYNVRDGNEQCADVR